MSSALSELSDESNSFPTISADGQESAGAAANSAGVDDIFATAKEKAARIAARKSKKGAEADALSAIQAARLAALSKAGRAANRLKGDDSPEPLRFDSELGMNIYSVGDLKIGAGAGDTPQCPFDCQCCF